MKVVNIRQEPYSHFIGRRSSWRGNGIFTDIGNPCSIPGKICPICKKTHYGPGMVQLTRDRSLACFEQWARSQSEVLERIRQLPEDAVLGCWCKPQDCHGDVIVKLWNELHAGR